jgi:Arc/MetJ-type ribon-helix-helix transcriptional regulator
MYILYMPQINLHTTPEFEAALDTLVRRRSLRSRSEAIRLAVVEAAERCGAPKTDFHTWIGRSRNPDAPPPRFLDDDDLWEKR